MALKGFKAFNAEEVRFIKENLLREVTIATLARHFGVSVETISKIKRGVTYTEVVVEGEERLRPQSPLGDRIRPLGPENLVPRGQTEEEFDAKAAESQRILLESLGMNPDGTIKE